MSDAFYIVGPSGVGKSELAARVAEQIGAEVVGADAFQVYRGFDLLTAKPDEATLSRAPHHLVGCISPEEEYSVARYLPQAQEVISRIKQKGKLPLVVGGSGLYVKALTHGLAPMPAVELEARLALDAQTLTALVARLRDLDPSAADVVDLKNKRRVVRAIEVIEASGKPFADSRSEWTKPVATCGVFLVRDRDDLHRRIDERTHSMFSRGVVDEVRAADQLSLSSTAQKIIGLADVRLVLSGDLTTQDCCARIALQTRQYAKRQITWFKRERQFTPINLSDGASDPVERILAVLRRQV